MSTAGGPSLAGIGRSGDSDLVLCMDAHDAGSYPGEPTNNYIKHTADGIPVSWWGDGSNQSIGTKGAVDITDNNLKYNGYPTILWTPGDSYNSYLNGTDDIDQTALSTVWTFSCYVKAQDGGTLKTSGNDLFMYFYRGTGSYPSDSGTGTVVDAGDGWYRLSLSVSGTSNYAGLIGFSNFRAGAKFYLSGAQLEKKSYPTPYVTGFPNSGEVYGGRPATTNLMIHGDVGTGTSFEDSSPSKHTVTASNHGSAADPVHSGVSKFSGGSIYFDGSTYSGAGSYLSVPDSTDWNFGTEDFTVDFWIRLNNLGTSSGGGDYRPHQEIIGNYDSTSGFRVSFTHKGTIEDGIWLYGPGGSVRAGNITGWVVDTWYHIAVVRSSGNVSIYKDGVLRAGPQSWATDVGDSSYPLIMGMDPRANPPTDYPLHGYLDEIRVTKGTALWVSAFTPPTRRNNNGPLVDLSGHDNAGNFATKDMTDVSTYRKGQVIRPIDTAVWDFDGTDDLTTIGYHSSLDTPNAATFSVWLYPEANGEFLNRGTSDGGASPDNPRFYVYWNLQKFYFDWSETGSDQYVTTAAGGFPANTWVNVVATVVAGGRMEVYINGGVASYETRNNADSMANPLPNTNDPIQLGAATWIPRYFTGKIASVGIYDVALTAQQIKQNFNSQRSRFKV